MIYTPLDSFYLSKEELSNSPSRQDGVDEETESLLRQYGCELIVESALCLKLPQAVMATAQVLLHRFYCKKSLAEIDVKVWSLFRLFTSASRVTCVYRAVGEWAAS